MTTTSQVNLEPITVFLNEFWHALGRPAVSAQILLIMACLFFGLFLSGKSDLSIPVFGMNLNRRARFALFIVVPVAISCLGMAIFQHPYGLIKQVGVLVLLFASLSLLFQIAVKVVNGSRKGLVEGYRDRVALPVFSAYCLFTIVQTFGDPGSLLGTPVIQLFQTPFSFGDVILVTFGLFLWVNLSSLLTQTVEWICGFNKFFDREASKAVYTLIRYGLIGFGLFVIVGIIGVNPTVFGLITGGLSVGIGLGLKEIISNFVSGIWLLLEGSTKPGDVINLNLLDSSADPFQIAKITDCGLRAVTVTNVSDHSERIIPNNLFFTNQITTYTKNHKIIARKSYFGVGYGSDPAEVVELITSAVASHSEVLSSPAPSTRFIEYGESSLNFYVKFFIKDVMGGIRVTSEVNLIIWEVLKQHQIEIPFPQRTLHFADPLNLLKEDNN
ncbi:mechanosensitive ion channel family protein [Synechococcus sp. UW140]|uniref:mechanosensitive ion channel family protein n=1 Tax=Synechococcus sp. UW140 TaxID=368503 RepID=UPI000E0ED2B0|nr:mechanosensitive ion channel domain-containing protein [Synechococcus sp. UW140]